MWIWVIGNLLDASNKKYINDVYTWAPQKNIIEIKINK